MNFVFNPGRNKSLCLTLKCKKMKKKFKFSVIVVVFSFLLINLLTTNETKAVPVQNAYGEEYIYCPQGADRFIVYRCTEQGDGCSISSQQTCYF